MKKSVFFLLFVLIIFPFFSKELHMLYMAQAGYQPYDIVQRADSFYEKTGIKVFVKFVEYEEQYELIMKSAKKEKADYDVILLDLIWTGDFADNKIIDPVTPDFEKEIREKIIPEIYNSLEHSKKIWAVPFLANFQLFYTNMDLLNQAGFDHPPSTLEELIYMSEIAKKKGIIKYPIFDSWNKQEVLICEYVWLVGAFGGQIVDSNGNITLYTIENLKALEFMVSLLQKGLINPYSLQSEEVFTSEVFLYGDCIFTTNWVFLTGLLRESNDKIIKNWQLSLIPVSEKIYNKGIKTSTISGFQGLSVTHNSTNKEMAWQFIKFLSSPEFQRMHLNEMSVWKEVWEEDKTKIEDPYIDIKKNQIIGVHHRPIHPQYMEISEVLQKWIYDTLLGKISPPNALQKAQKEIEKIIEDE